MTRSHALSAALSLLAVSTAVAQQPAPRLVGPSGPGLQPQVATGPYQRPTTAPAARGVNPFAGPAQSPAVPPGTRLAPRQAPPVAFAPPAPQGVPNNPAVFNPGAPAPHPLLILPPGPDLNPVAFNPVFVSRRGVVSAYYVPPTSQRSPNLLTSTGEVALFPTDPEAGPAFLPPAGESRFLPWIW